MPPAKNFGPKYWQRRLGRWPRAKDTTEGYSLLLPVPGDLPAFLRLALAVCSHQEAKHRVETLVIPDRLTLPVRQVVSAAKRQWQGTLEMLPLPAPERWVLPRLQNPARNHALQLLTGVAHSKASHILLHDADLFLLQRDFLDQQFVSCHERELACLGVSPAWDKWLERHGRRLVATWELCAKVDWMRAFAPYLHMGHENTLFGEKHTFDTTLYTQALTHPGLIEVSRAVDFAHLGYVISHYRHFVKGRVGWHIDNRFLLLFVRLLADLYDPERSQSYQVPDCTELAAGLSQKAPRVKYPSAREGRAAYKEFRCLLARALSGPWATDFQRSKLAVLLEPFDHFYDFEDASGTDAPRLRAAAAVAQLHLARQA